MTDRGDLEPIRIGQEVPTDGIAVPAERDGGARRRWRWAKVAFAALVAAVIALMVGWKVQDSDQPGGVEGLGTSASPTSTTEALPSAIGPWRRLSLTAHRVERGAATPVWTGSELIMWGLEGGPAVRFDPRSETARGVPAAPIGSPNQVRVGTWTGQEVIVWGHSAAEAPAAYNVATGEWRRLPPPPVADQVPFAVVWTGSELIVWGDLDRTVARRDGAAYNPATNRWRPITPAPVAMNLGAGVWTGREMLVVGALLDRNNRSDSASAEALAYDPLRDAWRRLGSADLATEASWAVWNRDRLVAWDYVLQAREWTAARGWRKLAAIPLEQRECYPGGVVAGPTVLMTYCDQTAILRPNGNWEAVAVPGKEIHAAVVAGDRIVMWTDQGAWALGAAP